MSKIAYHINRIDDMTTRLAALRLINQRSFDDKLEIRILLFHLNRHNRKISAWSQRGYFQWLFSSESRLTYLYTLAVLVVTIGLIVFWCLVATYLHSSLAGFSLGR